MECAGDRKGRPYTGNSGLAIVPVQEGGHALELPKRKQIRLTDYDYGSPGTYFVTICTRDRRCFLSDIVVGEGLAPPEIRLTRIGKLVEEQICTLPERYPSVTIDKFVIMPNHIHLIVSINECSGGASPSPTLFDVMRVLKSITTRIARPYLGGCLLWQRSYHEHVIRNETDYCEIWEYIENNPAKWVEDRYYAE